MILDFIPAGIRRFLRAINNQIIISYYRLKFRPLIIRKNTSDLDVFKQIFISKDYDFPLDVKPKLIIDAGANVGYAALFFSDKFPSAQIMAIEPEESNFQILLKNTENRSQIKPVKSGLWHKKAMLKISNPVGSNWAFMTRETKPGEKPDVETITISEILNQSKYDEIDILKIDIEGAEKELFSENFESWLGKVNVLIIELHDRIRKDCSKPFYLAISNYDFKKIQKGENIILFKTNSKN